MSIKLFVIIIGQLIKMKNNRTVWAGLFSCLVFYSTIGYTAAFYVGEQGEDYSFLNHFISDLGNPLISRYAPVFNIGIVMAGLGFGIFAHSLKGYIPTRLANVSIGMGMVASVLCTGVGLVPAHYGNWHLLVALSFFSLMTLAMTLYSWCIWRDKNKTFPRYIAIYGFCAFGAFCLFLLMPKDLLAAENELGLLFKRPRFWALAFWEWIVFFILTTWVILVAVYVWSREIVKN